MAGHTARAGFSLAVGLFVWGVVGVRPPPAACVDPFEWQVQAGHTTVVACDAEAGANAPLRGPASRLFGHRVDINCSDALTLQTLFGIGPARARAIVEERARGRYQRVDDLVRVHGIGPKTLARLRGELVVRSGPGESPSVQSPGCRTNSRYLHPPAARAMRAE